MKLAVLCNNSVAFPALQFLRGEEVAVGTAGSNTGFIAALHPLCDDLGYELKQFSGAGFGQQLADWISATAPEAVLMMTCPFRIPAAALNRPPKGFVNFHYGLLPQYRGANPVFEQIRRREPFGGITVHQVDEDIDTGGIVLQKKIALYPDETFGAHMTRLGALGAEMLQELLPLLREDRPLPVSAQNPAQAHYYKRPTAEDVTIRWDRMDAAGIVALANACNPWNFGAATSLSGNTLGISSAVVTDATLSYNARPGTIITVDNQSGLSVATADHRIIRLEMLYVNATFMPGFQLAQYGVHPGMKFN